MYKPGINIIAAAVLALAGCTTVQPQAYSHGAPIMSAGDAQTMIRVEVKAIESAAEEQVIVAAVDQASPEADRLTR